MGGWVGGWVGRWVSGWVEREVGRGRGSAVIKPATPAVSCRKRPSRGYEGAARGGTGGGGPPPAHLGHLLRFFHIAFFSRLGCRLAVVETVGCVLVFAVSVSGPATILSHPNKRTRRGTTSTGLNSIVVLTSGT